MKNVTVSVPDEVYRQARIRAAERGRSLSALFAEFLRSLSSVDTEFERRVAMQRQVKGEITSFRASERLSRDEAHDRALR